MDQSYHVLQQPGLMVGIGILVGIVFHYGLFNRGEWHVQAPTITVYHILLMIALGTGRIWHGESSLKTVLDNFTYIFLGYVPALLASIVIYRYLFHPLTKAGFAGPSYARVTKLWHVWSCRTSKNHLVLDELHHRYGDFVRTGPSEITVFHPEVFRMVDGPKSECIKSEWYDILHPYLALVTARVKSTHAARRRQWNSGFTTKALALHEQKILKYVDQLDACIESDARAGKVTNVRDMFFWFGFDAMGDFVFNKSFDMLKNQQWHHIIVRLQRALSLLGPFSPAPWLVQVGFKLGPRVSVLKDWFDMVAWCERQMRERIKLAEDKSLLPDLAHYLMEEEGTHEVKDESWFWLQGDSLLAIVAGSEPTAAALIGVFCELSKHPEHAHKLYDEVKNVDVRDIRALTELPYLNAVINETLRLYPALLTGGARKTTENGIVIGGVFIPPHTTIVAPRYTISRREDCFERGTDFVPERWCSKPEMLRNAAASTPFGTGHHSCLGRFLATDTIRFVTARLVQKYQFCLAPGDTGLRVTQDMKDQFTSNPGGLSLKFQLRQRLE